MSASRQAQQLDHDDLPQQAAHAYETLLATGEGDLTSYLNLAVLYFECNDGGYAAHHRLSVEFLTIAWDRMHEVLDEAESRFGRHSEIEFWRRYFTYILLSDGWMDADTCRALAESGESLVPYFYLFGSFANLPADEAKRYHAQALKLFEEVRDGSTVRSRYIRSVLDSAFTKYGFDRPQWTESP